MNGSPKLSTEVSARETHGRDSRIKAARFPAPKDARVRLELVLDLPGRETISIAAGTVDGPTGLRVASHWYLSQAGAYYDPPEDGLPRHERSGEGEPP